MSSATETKSVAASRPTFATGGLMVLAAALVVLGQLALVLLFDYPAIFDQPTADILVRYHQSGGLLPLAWLGFALGTLMLAPLALLCRGLCQEPRRPLVQIATAFGVVAGIAYVIGIMRWVLLARLLAAKLVDPGLGAQARETIVLVFQAVDVYCGNSFGETIAPIAHGLWVLLLGLALRQSAGIPRWITWSQIVLGVPIACRPLEYVGWPWVAELSDGATMLWTLLLLGLGTALMRAGRSRAQVQRK